MAKAVIDWTAKIAEYNATQKNVSIENAVPVKVQDELVERIASAVMEKLAASQNTGNFFPSAPSPEELVKNDIIVLPDVPVKTLPEIGGKKHPVTAVRELIAKINQRKVKAGKTYVFPDGTVDKGVHCSWDGYNASLRAYYGEMDKDEITAFTKALEVAGVVKTVPTEGGVKVYLTEEYHPKKNVNIISL